MLVNLSTHWQQLMLYAGLISLFLGLTIALAALLRKSKFLGKVSLVLIILGPLMSVYSVKSGSWAIPDCRDTNGNLIDTEERCTYP